MITIETKGNQIFLFGRNKDNKVYCEQKDFRPYFYVEDENGTYVSIDNKKLKKIECNFPYELFNLRKNFNKTYEADVSYVNRYIIDKLDEIKEENIRICYLDIEARRPKNGFEEPYKALGEITMIGCLDNYTNQRKRFILKDYDCERNMLLDFIRYIRETDPDMLLAYNGDGFDFPYIINRIKKLDINPNLLARNNEYFKGIVISENNRNVIEGRILFDLMYAYKTWTSNAGRESWSLDYISNYEGIGSKEKYKGSLDDLYDNNIEQFIKYNDTDVDLLKLLDDKLQLVHFFDMMRRMCFCKFEDVFMNSKMADCLCLKYAKNHNYVLPSINFQVKENFEGAIVQKSIPGLHKNIGYVDMKSLYPSLMIGFNLSYETLLKEKTDNCINAMDRYYFKKESGIIPSIVKPLLDRRGIVKKERDLIQDRESREYKTKYMEQYTLKTIANSFYGILGFPNFRLFNRDVADAITYLARKTITEVKIWFENKGYKIIYGDTDSILIHKDDITIEMVKNDVKEINIYFKQFYKQFGVEDFNNIIELEFESFWKTIFFKGSKEKGIKKKYAGIVIYEDGKNVSKFVVKGFESRRSDNPKVGREFLYNILKMIVEEVPQQEIELYIDDFKNKIKNEFSLEDIAIPIGISKKLKDYKNQIHVRASRLANERHKAGIQSGDKIKYLYVKDQGGVIGFKSDGYMWDGYTVDYDKMIHRIVTLKVAPIFDSLGWKHKYSVKLSTSAKKSKLLKNILKQTELW